MTTYTKPTRSVTGNAVIKLTKATAQGYAARLKMMALLAIIGLPFVVGPRLMNHSDSFTGFTASYADEYHTASEHVTIEQKPHDCEWSYAPIGNKACHYEKHVETLDPGPGHPYTGVLVTWQKVDD